MASATLTIGEADSQQSERMSFYFRHSGSPTARKDSSQDQKDQKFFQASDVAASVPGKACTDWNNPTLATATGRLSISGSDCTEVVIQRHLDCLASATDELAATAIVRDLMAGAVNRLHCLCACMLFRRYPRLTRPPTNLRPEELLSSVIERMMKAMRSVRPQNIRQFFAVCNQHMRWELNDLARRLDKQPHTCQVNESMAAAEFPSTCSQLSPNAVRILEAIDGLPDDQREAFDLMRLQGLSFQEAASIVGVSMKTVQRRLNRALVLLSEQLGDLQ
jgi:RNA polymerase sigma factor (sigma-70 family)